MENTDKTAKFSALAKWNIKNTSFFSNPDSLPSYFIQPNFITSVKKLGNDNVRLHMMTEKPFPEWTTLCAWNVDIDSPYFTLPAFQVEYITCTWLPRTRHTSSCQVWI